MKLLSFICTVKNGERYLDECIQSVVEHYPDAEFVIVDDGSTDGTTAILERWAEEAPQIRVITTEGVGRGTALNIAVEACTKPYVANIDADDVALPGRELLVGFLERADASAALAAGTSILLSEGRESAAEVPGVRREEEEPVFLEVGSRLHRGNPISHVGVVMKAVAIFSVGGYSERRSTHLDFDLWIRLAEDGWSLFVNDTVVALKRVHEMQSFEHGRHVRYVLKGSMTRIAGARGIRRKVVAASLTIPKLLWAIMPRPIRIRLSRHSNL